MSQITETQLKLRDAGTQMKLAVENISNEDILRSCVNAFISAARSVTMVMEKESAVYPELLTWYKTQTAEFSKQPIMRFFNERRVHTIHIGNVKPVSHTTPIWDLVINGKKLEPGTGDMLVWVFDNADEYMPGKSSNVFNLCEKYFLILKNLVNEWLLQKEVIEEQQKYMSNEDNRREEIIIEVVTLDTTEVMEAITHYMLKKYGKGRISEIKWLITPEDGHKLPPIKEVTIQCTVE